MKKLVSLLGLALLTTPVSAQRNGNEFDAELRCTLRIEKRNGQPEVGGDIVRYFGLSLRRQQATVVQTDPGLTITTLALASDRFFVTIRDRDSSGASFAAYIINRQDLTVLYESRFNGYVYTGSGRCERFRDSNAL